MENKTKEVILEALERYKADTESSLESRNDGEDAEADDRDEAKHQKITLAIKEIGGEV